MNKYVADFHRQLVAYKERYGHKTGVVSWHVLWYLIRNWFGEKLHYKRHGSQPNIGFILHGGIGDVVIAGAYIDKFIKKLDCGCKIFIFVTQPVQSVKILYKKLGTNIEVLDYSQKKRTPLDLLIKFAVQFPEIEFYRSKYIRKKSRFLLDYINKVIEFSEKYKHLFESESIHDHQIFLDILGLTRVSGMDAAKIVDLQEDDTLSIMVPESGKTILREKGLAEDKFISFAYSLDIFNKTTQNIRLLPKETMQQIIDALKKQFPEYKIVQLGSKTLSNFRNVDLNLVGKTSFEQLLALLSASRIHIDSECGMVHLRHALNRKTSVVVHGPTSISTKGYSENINVRSKICNCNCCEWLMGKNWQSFCIKTNSAIPACMQDISSEMIIKKVKDVLK